MQIQHVKAHSGVLGNEIADSFAAFAASTGASACGMPSRKEPQLSLQTLQLRALYSHCPEVLPAGFIETGCIPDGIQHNQLSMSDHLGNANCSQPEEAGHTCFGR